jgi:hypothetical protein
VFHVLTDKEVLEKALQQGLKEEQKQYKDSIAEFLMKMKDRSKVEDLTFHPSRYDCDLTHRTVRFLYVTL